MVRTQYYVNSVYTEGVYVRTYVCMHACIYVRTYVCTKRIGCSIDKLDLIPIS